MGYSHLGKNCSDYSEDMVKEELEEQSPFALSLSKGKFMVRQAHHERLSGHKGLTKMLYLVR